MSSPSGQVGGGVHRLGRWFARRRAFPSHSSVDWRNTDDRQHVAKLKWLLDAEGSAAPAHQTELGLRPSTMFVARP